jgi:hypothetical protein
LEGRTNVSEFVSREALFRGVSALLGYESLKSAPKRILKGGFVLPKSSIGEHGLFNFSNALEKLKSANLRLGRNNKCGNADFRSTFSGHAVISKDAC